MQLGNLTLHFVNDGYIWLDGGGCFGLVPKVLWEKIVEPDELNRIPVALNCLLIESEGKRILVDISVFSAIFICSMKLTLISPGV